MSFEEDTDMMVAMDNFIEDFRLFKNKYYKIIGPTTRDRLIIELFKLYLENCEIE